MRYKEFKMAKESEKEFDKNYVSVDDMRESSLQPLFSLHEWRKAFNALACTPFKLRM